MKNKLIVVFSIIIVGIVLMSVIFILRNNDVEVNYTQDEIKFKDEYENLNGQEIVTDYTLKTVDIDVDNNVKYINDNEILDLLTNGTNVIYFGWSDCNWCRSIVPTLINTLKQNKIDTLYYYDFKSLRNSYENDDNDKSVKLYEEIVKIIGDNIESVFDEESNKSGEKKILAPTVVFIKNGELLGVHIKSVDSQLKSTDVLNKNQVRELSNIYKNYIQQMNAEVCVEEGC